MKRLSFFLSAGLLLALLPACGENHVDTDQISTASPTTRYSTHPEPDSSGHAPNDTITVH